MTYRCLSFPLLVACFYVAPILLLSQGPDVVRAADMPATNPSTAPAATQPADNRVTVAIFDFTGTTAGNPDLGKQISEVLTASLSGEPGVQFVDRASMDKILQEHQLNLTGLVDSATAIRAGKLVGAKIIITGSVLPMDKSIFITAKLVGTETSKLSSALVTAPGNADLGPMIVELSQKTADALRTSGPTLLANKADIDPLPALKTKLAGRKLPTVCVNIAEHHLPAANVAAADPAAETEVKNVLISAGITVIDAHGEAEMDKAGVDVAITGEGLSELNGKIGNLVSCSGRLELQATYRKSHQVLFSNRATTRAVDLAENIAGKAALQKAGHDLAVKLLEHFAEELPAKAG
jgi:TolB-like protein